MEKEILEILDNVRYWETCPDNYKETIERYLTEQNKALQLQQTGVMRSNYIDESPELRINVDKFDENDYYDGKFLK